MRFFDTVFSGRSVAMIFGAVVLSACTVEGPGPYPGPGPMPEPGPRFCTREYQPVCARRGNERQTFPNACEADRAGYRVSYPGECRREGGQWGGGGQWNGLPPRPGPGSERPTMCTREYRPVCATSRGQVRTFGNACEARAADYRIVDQNGPC
ncbi:peptidase [Pseudaminobacter arsenicus]|uniref:Peptidase n=1 Tax=Borborobacter arsenicus TaxID=1851146 RepID=A0A432V427_9HYPH|nr:Kazal-type serine protease inhibitor [Pseudaminobacter arsenicus]RUM96905.1 peptidase [Pseudaminobacter arsenicus]